jgi:putative nucleotidyltransferase-like protein
MKALPRSSSQPPELPAEQRRLFVEVLELMNRKQVPYVISGAFALYEHTGICRDTKDLDLFLPAENVHEALEALREAGFETEIPDPVWLAKAHRSDFFVDLITGMSNGAVTVEQSWIDRSTACTVLGVPSRVLGPEELIASKMFVTRRERFDGADICHVIYGARAKFDWDYMMELVRQHGDHWEIMLWHLVLYNYVYPAYTDAVPKHIWDLLLTKFRNAVMNPDPKAKFRGSLIDENMFWIDVNEWGMANTLEDLREARHPKITNGGPQEEAPAA